MGRVVACRDCGERGEEDETDLMPETCPDCFERRIAPVFGRARSVDELIQGLVAAGCLRDRVERLIRRRAANWGLKLR